MSTQIDENQPRDLISTNWELIDNSRTEMAKEIKSLANSLSGPRAKQLMSISRWLNGSHDYESLLERPDVICFCLPWVDALSKKTNQESLTEFETAAAVGVGFCKFENNAPLPRDLTPFIYPAIMFFVWLVMVTLASIYLLPQFREMFDEFGVELPILTRIVLASGLWLEANWIPLFVVVLLVPTAMSIFLWYSQRGRAYSLNWLDRRFSSFRAKLSVWATHFASLLLVGVDETEAIEVAGRCSSSQILQARCEALAEDDSQSLLHPAEYPLISNSLLLKDKAAKIKILEETSWYYQSVSRVIQGWWITWLHKSMLVFVFGTIVAGFASLFMPLKALLNGLFWW